MMTPAYSLSSGRLGVLRRLSAGYVHRLNVINRYGVRCTFGSSASSCHIVRIGTHLDHSSTLTSGTANCPLTFITTGITLNCALSRVNRVKAPGSTCITPRLSCCVYGVPH